VRGLRDIRDIRGVLALRRRRRIRRLRIALQRDARRQLEFRTRRHRRLRVMILMRRLQLRASRRCRCIRSSLPGSFSVRPVCVLYRWRMSTLDAPISSTTGTSTLDEVALSFVASPKFFRLLESHRGAVLTLRAREASYAQIQDLLKLHGIEVPESAVARFCRKYRGQVQRLRLNLEQETFDALESSPAAKPTTSISTVSVTPNPIASSSRKLRDLRGPV
jgi:hypothetical protein